MTEKPCAYLSVEDINTLCVWDQDDYYSEVNFDEFVRNSFSDMPPKLAIEWAARLETFAHMLRDYAENGQPAVCFPTTGTEGA